MDALRDFLVVQIYSSPGVQPMTQNCVCIFSLFGSWRLTLAVCGEVCSIVCATQYWYNLRSPLNCRISCFSLLWLSSLIGARTVGGQRSLQNKSISGTVLAGEGWRGQRSEFTGTGGKPGFRVARFCSNTGRAFGRRGGQYYRNHRTDVSETPAATMQAWCPFYSAWLAYI